MDDWAQTEVESVKVRVTVDDFGESFWATRMPGKRNVGTVNNALMNGAIGYGDLIEWNDEGEVVAVLARSDRATLMCTVQTEPDDLVTQTKWEQASKEAAEVWTDRGVIVERGLGGLLIGAFVVQDGVSLRRQCLDLLRVLPHEDWPLIWEVGPYPGAPTDASVLKLSVPPPYEDTWDFGPDMSGLPDIGADLLADNSRRDLISRLKAVGHIHAALDDAEVLDAALHLLATDFRCYRSCQAGHNDQVLVLAGRILCFERGMLTPENDGLLFEMDFLEE